jgi:hypothetical protein
MGTNYYWIDAPDPVCSHCKRDRERVHIGKSSCGRRFILQLHRDPPIRSFIDWVELLTREGTSIVDDYGHRVQPADMLRCMMVRSMPDGRKLEFLESEFRVGTVCDLPIDLCEREIT